MPDDYDLCNFSTTFKHNKFLSISISFIFSHPLYFSYFIFFSPYFFKFIFFISFSPLFLTTTLLLLLSVLATTHSKLVFPQTIVDKLKAKLHEDDGEEDDEFVEFEDFEIYKIVFRDSPLIMEEDSVAVMELEKERLFEELDRFEESTAEIQVKQDLEKAKVTSAVYGNDFEHVKVTSAVSGSFSVKPDSTAEIELKRNLEKVTVTSAISTAEIELKSDLENDGGELQKAETVIMTSSIPGDDQLTGRSLFTDEKSNSSRFSSSSSFGSFESPEAIGMNAQSDHEEFVKLQPLTSLVSGEDQSPSRRLNNLAAEVVEESQKLQPGMSSNSVNWVINNKTVCNLLQVDSSSSFGSYGSMRKEKEWKRTLACKLYEERRNLEGGEEGMDSLWESYETDNSSRKSQLKLTNKNKTNRKSEFKCFDDGENEEDDDEFMSNGQLCCLKALKLSTGKMNLGMGKPNLVKISKALKGFGWLHHVGSKHGKKK